jgi:hypothetical protein
MISAQTLHNKLNTTNSVRQHLHNNLNNKLCTTNSVRQTQYDNICTTISAQQTQYDNICRTIMSAQQFQHNKLSTNKLWTKNTNYVLNNYLRCSECLSIYFRWPDFQKQSPYVSWYPQKICFFLYTVNKRILWHSQSWQLTISFWRIFPRQFQYDDKIRPLYRMLRLRTQTRPCAIILIQSQHGNNLRPQHRFNYFCLSNAREFYVSMGGCWQSLD